MTALHCCATDEDDGDDVSEQDIAALLAALLDHGAAIDQLCNHGQTALHIAAGNGKLPAVLCLLDRGANAALADSDGMTALHDVCSAEIVTALLAHGAPVNAVDCDGKTALHYSATRGNLADLPAARALLKAGADANAADKDGDIPLHRWAKSPVYYHAVVEFAQLLIDHGADVAAHNNANQRPSDVAETDSTQQTFLLAAEEAQRNNHRYKRPRLEDLQPPAAIAAGAEAAAAAEDEDESEDDSDDDEEDD
jgi:ankyrin repeat protein